MARSVSLYYVLRVVLLNLARIIARGRTVVKKKLKLYFYFSFYLTTVRSKDIVLPAFTYKFTYERSGSSHEEVKATTIYLQTVRAPVGAAHSECSTMPGMQIRTVASAERWHAMTDLLKDVVNDAIRKLMKDRNYHIEKAVRHTLGGTPTAQDLITRTYLRETQGSSPETALYVDGMCVMRMRIVIEPHTGSISNQFDYYMDGGADVE